MATFEEFDEIRFFSFSTLLSVCQGQQEPEGHDAANEAESSDNEDWDLGSEKDSVMLHELSSLEPNERLLIRFLDHLAETFAREKSIPPSQAKRHERRSGNRSGRGASHVAASGLMIANREPTVYVAKNGGVDDVDKDLARNLTIWIRALAATRTRPTIDKDIMWMKLVNYCRQRLDIYAAQIECISQPDLVAAFAEGSDGVALARELHSLSAKFKTDRSLETLQQMISVAYRLRYEPAPDSSSSNGKRARRTACFLGRLRAAYETLKETAIQLRRSFSKLTIVCLQAPEAGRLPRDQYERRIEELAGKNGIPRPKKGRIANALGKGAAVLTPCHAEVQILMHFECCIPPMAEPFPYIGCSKKSCWLCNQLLSLYKDKRSQTTGFYQTRCCHGRVYPLWRIALPIEPPPDPSVRFYLSATLQNIQGMMLQRLQTLSRIQRPAVAESSANVTVAGGPLKRRALAKQRLAESCKKPERIKSDVHILKDFVCSRECLRIPATGESPHLVSIKFYGYPDDYHGREPSPFCIPDFRAYWGISNFERAYRRITVTKQNPEELDGEYLLYWCRNTALSPNQNLMSLLGIETLGIDEHFWYGDVFITRFHEDDETFEFHCEDVPRAYLAHNESMINIIRALWERKEPENEIRTWQHFDASDEKIKADKDVLLGRMSPTERSMLKQIPGMLEYLAISACDDGALVDVSFQNYSDTPGYVEITSLYRRTAMDRRGWKGFSSDDL